MNIGILAVKMYEYMKTCLNCENQFLAARCHPNQKYCSHKCARYVIGRRRYSLGASKQKLRCSVCDKEFVQKRLNNTEYCDHKCKKLGVFRKYRGLVVKGPRKHVRGSGYTTAQGYKMLSKKHPNASKRGQILEHIWIMANHIGRPLLKKESVHHKNGVRDDNRLENLELWSSAHGMGQRVSDKLKWCKEFLEQYGHQVIMNENAIGGNYER